jgi:hypothetical protein
MTRCPFCDYETPEPDDGDRHVQGWQEVAHMTTDHPEVIRQRLKLANLLDEPDRAMFDRLQD